MRLRTFAPVMTVFALGAPAANAQGFDAADTIRGFLTDAAQFHAQSATVGNVASEGDTVTATDVAMRWSVELGSAEAPATFSASVTAPRVEVTGFAPSGEGWEADRIALPTLSLNISLGDTVQTFTYDLTARDYVITNTTWAKLPAVPENAAAPVSRFAPLIDWAVDQSYERASIAGIEAHMQSPEGPQDVTYGPIEVGPAKDGRVERFSYGATTSKQTMQIPNPDPAAEVGSTIPVEFTMTAGPSTGTGMDVRPLVQLLTGKGDATGLMPILEQTSLDGMELKFGDMFSAKIGPSVIEGVGLDPTRGPLLSAIDGVVVSAQNGEEPKPEAIISLMLDVYGAFGLERYSLAGFDATFMGGGTAKMGEFAIEGLSAAGLERVSLNGFDVAAEGTTAKLGTFELADFKFPARDAFMAMIMGSMAGMQPDFASIAGSVPLLGRVTIKDVAFASPMAGTFDLGTFETKLENYVGAIPTRTAITLSGLKMPVSMLPDPSTQMMFGALNLTEIAADGTLTLGWDRDSQRVELDNKLTVGGVGDLALNAALGGIPAYVFEDPTRAQEAVATASLVGLGATFKDEGLTPYLLDMVATQSGVSAADFIAGITQQTSMQIAMLTGDQALGEQVSSALATFLADPKQLHVELSPTAPVPVAQIMGAAMTAPQTLPGLLKFSIDAN